MKAGSFMFLTAGIIVFLLGGFVMTCMVEAENPPLLNNVFLPAGTIVMWSGPLAEIPDDWAICDGRYGTPDLRGMVVVSAEGGTEPGLVRGEKYLIEHKHVQAPHLHELKVENGGGNLSRIFGSYHWTNQYTQNDGGGNLTESAGQASAVYALIYIMKL